MSASDSWKLLVFRSGRRVLNGNDLVRELLGRIEQALLLTDFSSHFGRDTLIEALLRSGELECALADDEGCSAEASVAAEVTDALARALFAQRAPQFSPNIVDQLSALRPPGQLTVSDPEGFCYYALHPLDYADLLHDNPMEVSNVAVVGIRAIGTTLGAVVGAWFESRGNSASRISVRPNGHPFDRRLDLNAEQRKWITASLERNARFFIVDEGPGLSGSSFLAVAEALGDAGVPTNQIVLLPSSQPNLNALIAPNAKARWKRFTTLALKPTRHIPKGACECIGGGEWRKRVFASEAEWPAVWGWTERQKYLSADHRKTFRFDGHGHYGKAVRHRSTLLAEYGWGAESLSAGDGFTVSQWIDGQKPGTADRETVIQLARYCAFRAENFACEVGSQTELEEMVRINLARALGIPFSGVLPVVRPVIADARMMPHEWICISDGRLLKVDAASHGDDHFFPGPTDIAWDLAGAIVEWRLNRQATELLLSEYRRTCRDDISRIPVYLVAYLACRLGFLLSAGQSASLESARFAREAAVYTNWLQSVLADSRSSRDHFSVNSCG